MGLFNIKRRQTTDVLPTAPPPSPPKQPAIITDLRHGSRSSSTRDASPIRRSDITSSVYSTPSPLEVPKPTNTFFQQAKTKASGVPNIKLKVLLDPLPHRMNGTVWAEERGLRELVDVEVEEDAGIEKLQDKVEELLGVKGRFSIGCYKVSMPIQAYEQAKAYTNRFSLPVHLISHFPSANLSDPRQLPCSFSNARRTSLAENHLSWDVARRGSGGDVGEIVTRVKDWWPGVEDVKEGEIQVLVRMAEYDENSNGFMTLLAHFSQPGPAPCPRSRHDHRACSNSPSPIIPSQGDAPYPPVALEVPRNKKIQALKEVVLKADTRPVGSLDKVVLWRVDMSWEEMRNCEAFGGLKNGSMPWPYPPNAPTPVSMDKSDQRVSEIFPETHSNPNLVSLYVYIQPSAQPLLARHKDLPRYIELSGEMPAFEYPMRKPLPPATPRLEKTTSASDVNDTGRRTSDEVIVKPAPKSRRGGMGRPNTAPGAIGAGSAPAPPMPFGARSKPTTINKPSLRHDVTLSPLAQSPMTDSFQGLGIMATAQDFERPIHTRNNTMSSFASTVPSSVFDRRGSAQTMVTDDTSLSRHTTRSVEFVPTTPTCTDTTPTLPTVATLPLGADSGVYVTEFGKLKMQGSGKPQRWNSLRSKFRH